MGTILAGVGVGKLIQGGASMIGAKKGQRKIDQELAAAEGEFRDARRAYKDFQFSNPWQQMENVAEDLTVNTQAAEFQAMQADQALAASLDTMLQAGGGAGSAQAIANAALMSQQGVSASIQQQEAANQAARVRGAMEVQARVLQGEEDLQSQKYIQTGELANLAADRKRAADMAKQKNQNMFMSGLGTVAQGLASADIFKPKAD